MLSIIVPVYNVKPYLSECLQSIDEQSYKECEVIVVDDGSTDGSGQIVDEFCSDKSLFRVFHKENGGLMSAWLYGFEKSQGDFIGFVDSDDMVCPDMFEKMIRIARDTDADIVMCGRKDITQTTEVDTCTGEVRIYESDGISYIHDNVFPSLKGGNISSARWNKIYKRSIFEKNIKYCRDKSRYCEDRYIVPAVLLTAKSLVYIDEPLYIYRMRKTANSKSPSKDLVASLESLYCIQIEMLKDKGLYEKYRHNLEIAKLNYMKIAFERNLVLSASKEKMIFAKQILSPDNRNIVISNKSECVHKFGRILFLAAKLNSPILLVMAAFVNGLLKGRSNGDWFA